MKVPVWFGWLLIGLFVGFSKANAVGTFPVYAAPCTLEWDASPDSSVTGYALYYGPNNSSVTNRLNVGNAMKVTITNLPANVECFFFVVAYNATGTESEPSNVLIYAPPAMTPLQIGRLPDGTMKIELNAGVNANCHVEFTPTLNPPQWQTLSNVLADASGHIMVIDPLIGNPPSRFYRVVEP